MFGRDPKPGSRKAKTKYDQGLDESKSAFRRTQSESAKMRDTQWNSYADTEEARTGIRPRSTYVNAGDRTYGGMPTYEGASYHHPEWLRLDNEHKSRVWEASNAARDVNNDLNRRYVNPSNDGTFGFQALGEARNQNLNRQQFGGS